MTNLLVLLSADMFNQEMRSGLLFRPRKKERSEEGRRIQCFLYNWPDQWKFLFSISGHLGRGHIYTCIIKSSEADNMWIFFNPFLAPGPLLAFDKDLPLLSSCLISPNNVMNHLIFKTSALGLLVRDFFSVIAFFCHPAIHQTYNSGFCRIEH